MAEMTNLDTNVAFSYEVFDRQLSNFLQMSEVLVDGWEDYDSQEMSCDIKSLYIKASRLCYMADQDLALQHADVTQERREKNEQFHNQMEELMSGKLVPFVQQVVCKTKDGKMLEGHELPMFPSQLSGIFPRIFDLLKMQGMGLERLLELQEIIVKAETMVGNENPFLLAQLFGISGISYEEMYSGDALKIESSVSTDGNDSSESTEEMASPHEIEMLLRLWDFLRFLTMTSYLLLHFRRVCHVTSKPLETDTIIRLIESKVQKYMSEGEGKRQLDLYQARLQYENDGKPLDIEQWLKARRNLKAQVSSKFELAFLYYGDDINKAGEELAKLTFTAEELDALIDTLAKYQLITRRIHEIIYPEEQTHTWPNEAFNLVVNGRNVDMLELKKSIGKMAKLVEKKNQWFCVWSVLKHLNLIREECVFATFAHQMMSKEWFGDSSDIVSFTADNLSDYSHYFNEFDYTDWDEELFLEKKDLYGMTKWSPKLCQNFSQLCEKMMKAIWGYQFLGINTKDTIN